MGNKKLQIEYRKIANLKPYDKNPRRNNATVAALAESIRDFGFKVPIVIDKNGVIVAGHTRLKAAKKLKMIEVPCIVAEDLSEAQLKAFRLADNKIPESSEWDDELLSQELQELLDMDMDMTKYGFELDEEKEEEEEEEAPEVQFSEFLGEENNYLVLKFNSEVDWLQACSVFGVGQAKAWSTRKDGRLDRAAERIGTGRVLDGKTAINKLLGDVGK